MVLGAHRSGTSAMAGVLGLAGARLPNDPLPPAADNERGFWESASIVALNDLVLQAQDSAWDDIFAGAQRPYLSSIDHHVGHTARTLLKAVFEQADLIVLKDPRINVLVNLWDAALRAEGYAPLHIVMVRSPYEVAQSLLKRNGLPVECGLMLWLDSMLAAERDTQDKPRLFVNFGALVSDGESCLQRIEDRTGISLPKRTPGAAEAIRDYLSPSLVHHSVASAPAIRPRLQQAVDRVYKAFRSAAQGDHLDSVALDQVRDDLDLAFQLAGGRIAQQQLEIREYVRHAQGLQALAGHLQFELNRQSES